MNRRRRSHGSKYARLETSRKALARTVQSGRLLRILETAVLDRETVRSIASRSYHHYNGFDKIVLSADERNGEELRLHLWRLEGAAECEIGNVHDHRWDFCSVIVSGSYSYETFEASSAGDKMLEYVHRSRQGSDNYAPRLVNRSRLLRVSAGLIATGESYFLPNNVLHRVKPEAEVTMSLVAQGPQISPTARIFADLDSPMPEQIGATPFTDHLMKRKIEEVIESILR
ncbi:MAG: hypothetical protein ABL984_12020 [Pyrinomonadaceae bacterium]